MLVVLNAVKHLYRLVRRFGCSGRDASATLSMTVQRLVYYLTFPT